MAKQQIWNKGNKIDELVARFTVGNDRELDMYLAKHDVLGTMAHVKMLEKVGLLEENEREKLEKGLKDIYHDIEQGKFTIEEGVEDIHSQIEITLTEKLGEIGKKIHSGRSRNDQVLLCIRLFVRDELQKIVSSTERLFHTLIEKSEEYKHVLIPGYTHLQVAMPSSFGLWFGAYAESLADDLLFLQAAFKQVNQNPLGSAAGYGSSFPLDRQMTTGILGFDNMNYNVVYAQMGRGKTERNVSFALASLAGTLSKLAYDACLFMSQNFNFISLPEEFTTGSSIMPHKKNPDVFELVRSKCNKLQALSQEMTLIINNLPSGYFRDLQVLKENFFPSFQVLLDCLEISHLMLEHVIINEKILDDDKYKFIFSVEEVNKLVVQGVPFRDAYRQIGESIADNTFEPDKNLQHSHQGSLGNLCTDEIRQLFQERVKSFAFEEINEKLSILTANKKTK